jgi:hypothetical protein
MMRAKDLKNQVRMRGAMDPILLIRPMVLDLIVKLTLVPTAAHLLEEMKVQMMGRAHPANNLAVKS